MQNKDGGFVSVFRRSSEVQNNVGRSMKDINSIVSANKIWPLTLPQKDTCIFHLSLKITRNSNLLGETRQIWIKYGHKACTIYKLCLSMIKEHKTR